MTTIVCNGNVLHETFSDEEMDLVSTMRALPYASKKRLIDFAEKECHAPQFCTPNLLRNYKKMDQIQLKHLVDECLKATKKTKGDYEKLGEYLYQAWGDNDLEESLKAIPGVDIVHELNPKGDDPKKYVIMLNPRYNQDVVAFQIRKVLARDAANSKLKETFWACIKPHVYWFWGAKNAASLFRDVEGVERVYSLGETPSKYTITIDPRYDAVAILEFIKQLSDAAKDDLEKAYSLLRSKRKVTYTNFENYLYSDVLNDIRTEATKIWSLYAREFAYGPIKTQEYQFGVTGAFIEGFTYRLLGRGFMYDISENTINDAWGHSFTLNDLRELLGHLLILEFALANRVDVTS